MDREWLYKQIDVLAKSCVDLSAMLDVQTRLIEDMNDRLASLEECARLAPKRAVRRSRNKEGSHVFPPS